MKDEDQHSGLGNKVKIGGMDDLIVSLMPKDMAATPVLSFLFSLSYIRDYLIQRGFIFCNPRKRVAPYKNLKKKLS